MKKKRTFHKKTDNTFYLKDGTPIKTINGLIQVLDSITLTDFNHHVTKTKNDFANWIKDVFHDNALAFEVSQKKTKEALLELLKKHSSACITEKVPEEHYFILNDGRELKCIQDFILILEDMSDETFNHHVNEFKNDFANWIEHIVEYQELAESIKKLSTKKEMLDLLKKEFVVELQILEDKKYDQLIVSQNIVIKNEDEPEDNGFMKEDPLGSENDHENYGTNPEEPEQTPHENLKKNIQGLDEHIIKIEEQVLPLLRQKHPEEDHLSKPIITLIAFTLIGIVLYLMQPEESKLLYAGGSILLGLIIVLTLRSSAKRKQ